MVITAQHTKDIPLKPGYKQTEVGVIPEDWEVKSLQELGMWKGGATPSMSNASFWVDGTIFWASSGDIKAKILSNTSSMITENAVKLSNTTLLKEGAILIVARSGILRRYLPVAKNIVPVAINQDIKALIPNSQTDVDYLLQILSERGPDILSTCMKSGTTVESIEYTWLKKYQIPLPPLPEQKAIAAALSDVDALITSLDQLITKKRDIKQATMQQLLTGRTRLPGFSGEWEVKTFGEMFQFLNTANNARSDLVESGDIQYVHYGDIHTKWRTFLDCSRDAIPFIHKDKVSNIPFLEDADVVMADASEDYEGIGISVEVKNVANRKVVAGLHTLLLRGDKTILADGFKGYLQYIPDVKDALKKAATGISVYGISKNNLKHISIRVPDIAEQRAIATTLSDMDEEIAELEQRREKTRALKQGMMQELLTGKVRLR